MTTSKVKFSFEHPENNKLLEIETDKKFIMVYGKNGSGKTSLSRSSNFDSKLVFNDDFVNKNIFITDENGIKMSPENRKNFSEIWIGEDIVKIVNERNIHEDALKVNTLAKDDLIAKISGDMKDNEIKDFEFGIDIEEKEFDIVIRDISTSAASFKSIITYNTDIKNDDLLKQQTSILKNNLLLDNFNSAISSAPLLNEIINNQDKLSIISNLNSRIQLLNEDNEKLIEIDNLLLKKEVIGEVESKIRDWYFFHKNRSSCLFCGNDDIETSLSEWREVFENEINEIKADLIKEIETYISTNKPINSNKQYIEISPETIDYIVYVNSVLNDALQKILDNIETKIVFDDFSLPSGLMEIDKIKINIKNFILNKYINQLSFFSNNEKKMKAEIIKIKDNLNTTMESNGKNYEKGINETLKKVGLDKDISLTINRRGSVMSYQVNLKNDNEINTLSNGQQHRLALALFLYSLKAKDYKDKTIVIDDPVVTLDSLGYHQIKKYLTSDLIPTFKDNGNVRLLILTHDFHYLTVQLQNILEDPTMLKITEIYKLTHDDLIAVDINLLFKDDISLFKLTLESIESVEGLTLLPHLNLKIFRHLVDLKQRIQGSNQTSGINLEALFIEEDAKKVCREFQSKNIKYFSKKDPSTVDVELVIEDLKRLKKAVDVLGFGEILEETQISNYVQILKDKISMDLTSPVFDIMIAVNYFLFNNADDLVRNYIMHPRNSFTSNLITLSLDEIF